MNKLFTGAGVALIISAAALAPKAAQAQEITPDPIQAEEITPTSVPNDTGYGLVQSIDNQALQVRHASGTSATYPLGEGVTAPADLSPGDLVVFDTTRKGVVKELSSTAPDRTYEGTVQKIEGEQVSILPDGASAPESTTISPETATRLGIAEGERVRVTNYAGIGTTRVCALPAPVVEAPPPEVAPPVPFGGGEPAAPPAPVPIPALW